MSIEVKFKNRTSVDLINKKLLKMIRECPEYDVELIGANNKSVLAHRVVVSMYSEYLRNMMCQSSPDTKLLGN